MSNKKRTTETTIETHELWIIRKAVPDLSDTLGQHDVGFSRGGVYTLDTGFWPSGLATTFIPVSTPVGSNVTVQMGGITINFGNVTAPGLTTVHPGDPCQPQDPCRLPPGYFIFNNLAFDVTTTATVTGPITVTFDLTRLSLNGPPITPALVSTLRVFHGESGVLIDRTIPPSPVIPPNPIRVANVSSLSPFVIAVQPPEVALQSTLDDLRAVRQMVINANDRQRLDLAITSLTAALDPRLWLDVSHFQSPSGALAFVATGSAVLQLHIILADSLSQIPHATARFYLDRVLEADRRPASIAIRDVQAAEGNQQYITSALNELNDGDAFVAQSNFEQAIVEYAEAWGLALQALPR